MDKVLSIIIPCWNCSKTIGRLLDSILANNISKDIYEVIVCDDKSTDNFLDIVKTYEDKIDFVYCETTRDFHCPGNTRQAALPYIHGEWFTFIDDDDMFEPDALKQVLVYLKINENIYTVCTNFREYFYEENEYGRELIGEATDTWLHGKFFNKAKTLDEFGCRFEDDLFSHEDIYFNSYNLSHLVENGLDYIYLPIFTYKWVHNPESLSRSFFNGKYYYIETYLDDYVHGSSYPFFDLFHRSENQETKDFAVRQIMMTMLHSYFYYQASVWRLGSNGTLDTAYIALKNFKRKIINELNVDNVFIINYIYKDPIRYDEIKNNCRPGSNPFVETKSFRDFILDL